MSRKKPRHTDRNPNERIQQGSDKQTVSRKSKKHGRKQGTSVSRPYNLPRILILLAYILITTFTPNLMALDTNTPKFAALAALNLLAFIYLATHRDTRLNPGYLGTFFTTKTGLVFTGLLLLSLLSFTQAINLLESVIQFSKLFTVFSAAFILSVFFTQDLRLVRLMAIFFTGVLLFDAFSVFYYINEFIAGNIARITDIKSVYSNKNILASALFVKIPFALWLMVFDKGWLRRVAWLAVMTGIAATFFMVARAFYIGLIIITVLFTAYSLINYFRERQRQHLWLLGSYLSALLLALAIFSITQKNFYPGVRPSRVGVQPTAAATGRHTQGLSQQIASIGEGDSSTRTRLQAWNYSLTMIRANPLLGVGIGNWKISVLEHENQEKAGFIYLYKAHNDFLETTAETGIPGGLLYLGIYIFVGWAFLMAYFHRRRLEALYKYLFLAASGLIFFSFDAMFNFPHDRPEMMILFAAYVATGISSSYYLKHVTGSGSVTAGSPDAEKEAISGRSEAVLTGVDSDSVVQDLPEVKPWMRNYLGALMLILLAVATYVLYINFKSSITQRIAFQEIRAGQLKTPSEEIINGLPVLPNLSVWGESLRVLQARYLIHEEKYGEAIDILRPDKSNPWDARREYFMAMAFMRMNENDSVATYTTKAMEVKPFYLNNMLMAIDALEKKGELDRVEEILQNYLAGEKREARAWIAASNFFMRHEQLDRAVELIDEAATYMQRNNDILQQQTAIHHRKFVAPYTPIFQTASEHYQAGRYQEARRYLNEYLEHVPDALNAIRLRAFCNYHTQTYQACIDDVDHALEEGEREPSLINLRGASYRALGNLELACIDFKEAMDLGNDSGTQNYFRFCEQGE